MDISIYRGEEHAWETFRRDAPTKAEITGETLCSIRRLTDENLPGGWWESWEREWETKITLYPSDNSVLACLALYELHMLLWNTCYLVYDWLVTYERGNKKKSFRVKLLIQAYEAWASHIKHALVCLSETVWWGSVDLTKKKKYITQKIYNLTKYMFSSELSWCCFFHKELSDNENNNWFLGYRWKHRVHSKNRLSEKLDSLKTFKYSTNTWNQCSCCIEILSSHLFKRNKKKLQRVSWPGHLKTDIDLWSKISHIWSWPLVLKNPMRLRYRVVGKFRIWLGKEADVCKHTLHRSQKNKCFVHLQQCIRRICCLHEALRRASLS